MARFAGLLHGLPSKSVCRGAGWTAPSILVIDYNPLSVLAGKGDAREADQCSAANVSINTVPARTPSLMKRLGSPESSTHTSSATFTDCCSDIMNSLVLRILALCETTDRSQGRVVLFACKRPDTKQQQLPFLRAAA